MRQHGEQTARNRIGDYRPSGVSFSAVALIAAGVLVARPDESAYAFFSRSIRTAPIGFQAVVKPLRSAAKHRNRSAKAQSFGAISYAQPIRKTLSGGGSIDSGKSASGTIVDDLGFKPHAAARDDAPPLADVTLKLRDRNLGARLEGDSAGGLLQRLGAEESSVRDVKIRAAALDDRIVLTATESRSVYSADPGYLYAVARSSANPKFMGKERFLFLSNNEGFAGREKLEVKLLRLGGFSASVFATNTHVDMSYYTPPAAGRDGVATPFAAGGGGFRLRDRASVETGAQFRYGAFGLTSSFWKGNIADRIGEHAEARTQHTLSWSMQDDPLVASILPAPLARLAPAALRAGIIDANGEAPLLTPGVLTHTKSVVAGAEWEADGISVDVDYYSYRSVSGTAAGPATSQGSGVTANAQIDLAPITLKASGSLSPGTDSAQDYGAKSNAYSASVSMAYRAKDLPDLSIDANVGRYAYREGGDGWSDRTHSQYWNTTASLDIAKFLVDDDRERKRLSTRVDLKSLKMFYRYEYFSDAMLYGARAPNKGTIGVSLTASIY